MFPDLFPTDEDCDPAAPCYNGYSVALDYIFLYVFTYFYIKKFLTSFTFFF
jgi:hypothetical protein